MRDRRKQCSNPETADLITSEIHPLLQPHENVSRRRGPRIDESGRRRATVHYLTKARARRYPDRIEHETYPLLRLSGKWLREAGFGIGRKVAVEVADGRLVIEVV